MGDIEVPDDFATMFVLNLVSDEDEIRKFFGEAGTIQNLRLLPQKDDQVNRAGIITMSTGEEARKAMEIFKGREMEGAGRRLRLTWDTRALEKRNGGGGGFARKEGGGFGGGGGFGAKPGGFGSATRAPVALQTDQGKITYEGRELLPQKSIIEGSEVITGFVFKDIVSAPSTLSVPAASSNGFGFGAAQTEEHPVLKFGFGARAEAKIEPLNRTFSGSGVSASTALTETLVKEESKGASPVKLHALAEDVMPKIREEVSNSLGGGIKKDITARRRRIDVGSADNTVDAPKKEYPPIEVPEARSEGPSTGLLRLRARRQQVVPSHSSDDLVMFKEVTIPSDVGVSVVAGSLLSDGTMGFWIITDGAKSFEVSVVGKQLLLDMKTFYTSSQTPFSSKTAGNPLAGFYNNEWYRGKFVSSASGSMSRIYLVDSGKEVTVADANIRPLDKRFGDLPVAAVAASLVGLPKEYVTEWGHLLTNALPDFVEMLQTIKVKSQKPLEVEFVAAGVSASLMVHGEEKKRAGYKISYGVLVLADSTTEVFLIDYRKQDALENITKRVNDEAAKRLKPDLSAGAVNIVQYIDGAYYRGVIDDNSNDFITVELADFGNLFQCQADKIYGISEELARIPCVSVMGSLTDVNRADELKILSRLSRMIEEVLIYELLGGKLKIWDTDGQLLNGVEETCSSNTDTFSLQYDKTYTVGTKITGQIVQVVDPEMVFFCNGNSAILDPAMQKLQDDLQVICPTLPKLIKAPAAETVVCAQFTEDKQWYRAVVTDVEEDGTVGVLYIDYGNNETVSLDSIRSIPSELLAVPRFLIQILLSGIQPKEGIAFSPEAITRAKDIMENKDATFEVEQIERTVFCGKLTLKDGDAAQIMLKEGLVRRR